jgi:hypothetical protein
MAGGGGVEWYFGYNFSDNDLGCEDWHSRSAMWDQTRYALEFFQRHLPFWEMKSRDDITPDEKDYCLAIEGEIYAVYIPEGAQTKIDLTDYEGDFDINWFNPGKGGELQLGTITRIQGGHMSDIGYPPANTDKDWIALIVLVGI